MEYEVSHSCGHSRRHQLFGKSSERDRKKQWLETTLCSECFVKQQAEERAAAAAIATEKNAAAGLPALRGSPKQIAWAETIRSAALESAAQEEERFVARLAPESAAIRQEVSDALCLLVGELRQHAEARFWIDSRDDFDRYIERRLATLCQHLMYELVY